MDALNADESAPKSVAHGKRPKDDGSYVDRALLDSLESFLIRMKGPRATSNCSLADLHRIEQFLYHEASLLDARRYQEWFELLTDNFTYWIPSTYGNASLHDDVSINFDDRRRILDRITFTESGVQVAQTPPSRTLRSLSNVRAWQHESSSLLRDDASVGHTFDAAASLVIWTHRRGHTDCFVGHLAMMLHPRGDSFAIEARVIELLDADQPQGNNSFIL